MRKTVTTLAIVLAVVAGACGRARPAATSAPPSATTGPVAFPLKIPTGASGASVTIPKAPQRIISLSPTATEMLFAINAGNLVVAVDDQSNYPASAPKTRLSGFQPNVEAIAKYTPDVVVYSSDSRTLGPSLKSLGIAGLEQPAAKSLLDTYNQIKQLGLVTNHAGDASRLIDSTKSQILRIVQGARKFSSSPKYYHELDTNYFTATSKTFIGEMYGLLGLRDIADPADKTGSGYPQLSGEYIVKADPDLIFLADTKCCKQSSSTVARRAGWDKIAAVKNGNVVQLDDDIASRWGPRVVDLLRTIAAAVRVARSLPS